MVESDRDSLMGRLVVLYEDRFMLVVDKPAGVHCAPLEQGEKGTLLQMVVDAFPEVAGLPGVKDIEPGLVHRIDRDTSGAVVVARTKSAFDALRAAFQEREVTKTYRAVCRSPGSQIGSGKAVESRFAPLGPGGQKVHVVLPDETSPRVLRTASATTYRTEVVVEAARASRALVRAVITRGFRHQVRAHLAFLGLPIFGDPLYGPAVPARREERMYLHAQRLELPHPETGARLVVESPLPPCFASLMEEDENGIP
jgi:23S rRNA pseudouridine1911/1915/1917 synthase